MVQVLLILMVRVVSVNMSMFIGRKLSPTIISPRMTGSIGLFTKIYQREIAHKKISEMTKSLLTYSAPGMVIQ